MAKLYFYYSAMNAGKSTVLLQSSHNYRERGMNTVLYTASFDDRYGAGKIASRIGLESDADLFGPASNLYDEVKARHAINNLACVLVDEAQFLSKDQVMQLSDIADVLGIPVMCYGLRTDFQGELFPGSAALLALADKLQEIKTICHCGKKAIMVVRMDGQGQVVTGGAQVEIGGNDKYVSLCRRHWKEGMKLLPA